MEVTDREWVEGNVCHIVYCNVINIYPELKLISMLINTSITKKNNTVEHSGMLSLFNCLIRSPKFR